MFLILMVACGAPEEEEAPEEEAAPVEVDVEAVPDEVDFGALELGGSASQEFSIFNRGEAAVILSAVSASSDDLTVTARTNFPIPPGGSEPVTVSWESFVPAELDETIEIRVAGEDDADFEVDVSGLADGPVLSVSTGTVDFGSVTVGCTGEAPLTLSNLGTVELAIDTVSFGEEVDFHLEGTDGDLAPLPWTLAAGESWTVTVVYAPLEERSIATALLVTSSDPITPVADVELEGTGIIEAENSILFEVVGQQNVTALFALNAVVAIGQFSARFLAALPVFFDALQDAHAPYRVAFLPGMSGEVDGDVPYIDDTMSTADAMDAVAGMLANAGGDNDYLLQTLANGISTNRSWLLDESPLWTDSRLSLIGMNSDTEQSSGNATVYVLEYQAYKTDPTDIVVHAIGGDVPRGCSGTGTAEPFEMFYNAANETGGTFLSICEADWDAHMVALAAAVLGDTQPFVLTGTPAVWSIEVQINGVPIVDGWSYDAELNEVVFEDGSYPADGSELRIDYLLAVDCPE